MAKGIDPKFVHYGIRKDDLAMIMKRKTSSVMQSKKYVNKYDYADTEN